MHECASALFRFQISTHSVASVFALVSSLPSFLPSFLPSCFALPQKEFVNCYGDKLRSTTRAWAFMSFGAPQQASPPEDVVPS